MKVMVTGAAGQLGQDVMLALRHAGIEALGVDYQDFDLLDAEAVQTAVLACRPDAILHCAAYTQVDQAEQEPEKCAAINGMGTLNVVRAALKVDAKLLYLSTDYVFPGTGETPWEAGDPRSPCSVYGLSKEQGEEAVRSLMTRYFIVRTAWVFGAHGHNFVQTMLRLAAHHDELRVVDDQIGSPTYTVDLALLLVRMLQTDRYGVYHATNEGYCSWADFAEEIMRQSGSQCQIQRVTTAEYGAAAKRPANSRLSKRSLDEGHFPRLPAWQDALSRYLQEIAHVEN